MAIFLFARLSPLSPGANLKHKSPKYVFSKWGQALTPLPLLHGVVFEAHVGVVDVYDDDFAADFFY